MMKRQVKLWILITMVVALVAVLWYCLLQEGAAVPEGTLI